MAILKSPPKPPKNESVQVRVEEEIKLKLVRYAEFRTWLDERNHSGDEVRTRGDSQMEVGKKT